MTIRNSGWSRFPMALFSMFSQNKKPESRAAAHLTFGSGQFSRTISRSSVLFRRRIWIWPTVAVLLLSVIGSAVRNSIAHSTAETLQSQLRTVLDMEVAMVREWMDDQLIAVRIGASDQSVQDSVIEAIRGVNQTNAAVSEGKDFSTSPVHQKVATALHPVLETNQLTGYFIVSPDLKIVSASKTEWIGKKIHSEYLPYFERALAGSSAVCRPSKTPLTMTSDGSVSGSADPIMFACTFVRDQNENVIGALGFLIDPLKEFTPILQLGRLGASGETYAFDSDGLMVSESRFEDDLILMGLLPDTEDATSFLTLAVRDPGQNILKHGRPPMRAADLPMTRMAASATAGQQGVDLRAYRDYRGVPVIGAWKWLPELEIGIATEIDEDEAFSSLSTLHWTFGGLYGLLALAAVAIFVFTVVVVKLRKEAQQNAVEARELGQYRLESKLGSGAMGVVYKGYHSMLRRATAIKLLKVELINEASIKRFENEVQIACQLNHPNTISIYDYGQTPEGVFYYAMEYLDGMDLQEMVMQHGPLPEGRVIHILRQVCGSLYEAHSKGLVHRDIKPSNIMINQRGGEADVVKVLDFGLARALDAGQHTELSAADAVNGTALYMSPEAIQTPSEIDARSDIYALGAVGYFLLTGQPVFNADTVVGILQQHISAMPLPPSIRLGKPITEELESAIIACLSKNPSDRPESMRFLADMLLQAPTSQSWTREEGERWWSRIQRGLSPRKNRLARSVTNKFEQTMVNFPSISAMLKEESEKDAEADPRMITSESHR
ncbi:MAG: serine/threonine protein kinase [Planctomyces sp.]|nr:serine/threonine protein kinase [Planctomyces sp.]